jgi:HK97 family phage portal protein
MARKSIGLGLAMQTFGETYFGNGTHPSAVVTHPGILKDPSKLRDSLTATYAGLGQSHKLMLLEEGMKIDNIGIPPEDSQFLQSRQFQITEIAQWFNLPPHKLKDLTRSSFSNIESEQISFVQDSILPWLITLEQEYNTQLLTEDQLFNQKLYFKHNVEGLLRADVAGRGSFYRSMFNIGGMSINEIRGKEDMDPIENGDEHFVPLNMIPLSKINDPTYKQAPPPPPSADQEEKTTDIFKKRSEYGRKS